MDNNKGHWTIAHWILLTGWVVGAALNMAHVHGGFLTNYLADVAFPPWFYIYIRRLSSDTAKIPKLVLVGTWFGQSPERALISIFAVGAITELKTMYWPNGPITGTFDPLDILAYSVGLLICYYFDKALLLKKTKKEQT